VKETSAAPASPAVVNEATDGVNDGSDGDGGISIHDMIKDDLSGPYVIATGRMVVVDDRRYRVYRPHNSALSVLIIRRARKGDAGVFRCNLSGSSTRHKFMILNVTGTQNSLIICAFFLLVIRIIIHLNH